MLVSRSIVAKIVRLYAPSLMRSIIIRMSTMVINDKTIRSLQGGFDGSLVHSFDRCNENEMHSSKQCGYICVTMSNVCSESKMDVLSIRITRKVSNDI